MRKTLSFLGTCALLVVVGCAGPEQKLGRGLSNMSEIVRGAEFNRSMEQGGLYGGPDNGMAGGFITGIDRTLARTGVGIYEVVTFPLPSYDPVCTDYLSPNPRYADGFKPRKWSIGVNDTDHYLGFSGGDVFPLFPGSRFRVFDN